ncbi:MAG: putative DNA binding domain-containing protein [Propionibacteriaceae bacterium]|jgi:predicted HTH transcriptional regulator|nr:putative DNA binding domain-containing protein [Propionibacteriaceae bacterium]
MPLELSLDESGRVVRPEGKTREYKLNLASKDRVLQTVVAFANSAGGELVVGVRDDATVVGVGEPLTEQDRLSRMVADSIKPQLAPLIELVTVAGKTLLVASVPLGSQRPYYLKASGRYGGTYYRSGADNLQAGASMVDELALSSRGRTFDKLPCGDAKMEDLDLVGLAALLGREVNESTLRTLRLVYDDQGRMVPSNGGVLVASPHPETFLPHAWVQCARFRGPGRRNITDQASVYGPIPLAVDKVMDFLKRNAFLSAEFGDKPRRVDVWSIPLDPLKELVVNALVHSSYADHGTPIKVAFEDEAIWIESPGGLVPGMTVEKMRRGESSSRNPVLARVFRELDLIEEWGTGIPEVIQSLKAAGLPEPDFYESRERLRITVHIQNHDPLKFRLGSDGRRVMPRERQVRREMLKPSVQVSKSSVYVSKQGVYVSKHGPAILAAASRGPASRRDLLMAAGIAAVPVNYRRHILPLVESGLLAMTAPDSPTSPSQRYVVTDKGREALVSFAQKDDI